MTNGRDDKEAQDIINFPVGEGFMAMPKTEDARQRVHAFIANRISQIKIGVIEQAHTLIRNGWY